jgi:hypothetical protein
VGFGRQTFTTPEVQTMTEAIINLQAPLVKSYLLNALLINRKAFPIGYYGAQVLHPASRYSARLNAVRRDCLPWSSASPCQANFMSAPHRKATPGPTIAARVVL